MNPDICKKLAPHNFWEKKIDNLGFIRAEYLDAFESFLGTNLIKVFSGQRRVGKSYIFKQCIHYLLEEKKINPHNILYINTEIQDFSFIVDNEVLNEVVHEYKKEMHPKGKIYIFIDEIQEIKNWEKSVTSFLADTSLDSEIFITGSNSKLLSSELSTYLTGRYIEKEVFPFSYEEYCQFFSYKASKLSFIEYLEFSGIPELYNLPNKELQNSYIHALKDSILLKDVVQRYSVKNIDILEKIFQFIGDNIGNLFSLNAIVRKFKSQGIKVNTITLGNYIKYLENSFLIFAIDRFDMKGKKILEGEKKYYLNDLAFKNFFSSSFDYGLGKHLENYIARILRQKGYSIFVGTLNKNEIDFIAEKGKEKIYIQVAYFLTDKKVIDREYGNLEAIPDNWKKYVISLDDIRLPPKNGIHHLQAWNLDNL